MIRSVEIHRLRYFVAVAEELHFTRAARRLHLAQPGMSHQIRELERSLGTKLFVRSKRSVKLTDAGALLLPEARRIVEQTDAAEEAVKRAGRGELGILSLGFTPSAAGDIVPRAINQYRGRFPLVDIRLRVATTSQQIQLLLSDDLHVGLIRDIEVPTEITIQRLRREEWVVAMPRTHRLASRESVALTDLASEPFIFGPGHAKRSTDVIIAACAKAGFVPKVAQQTPDMATGLVLVASGIGVSLIPQSSGHLATRELVYRPLRGRPISMDLMVAWRRNRNSPMATSYIEVLRNVARDQPRSR